MNNKKITDFLFEIGTMRRLSRMHKQTLLTNDESDNIASHTFRVAMIGWFLAKQENVDPYKVVMMCLLHDVPETRSNDHNWVHKKYVKIFDDEIVKEQFGDIENGELLSIVEEYNKRESLESKVAKDADLIDQVLLLFEYDHQGNKEAKEWLFAKDGPDDKRNPGRYFTKSAAELVNEIFETSPTGWWKGLWTNKNR